MIKKIDSNRITPRDAKSYFGVLLDDNNRKPLCRLWFNGGKKYIGIFDDQKNETKHEISQVDDIFNFSDDLLKAPEYYIND